MSLASLLAPFPPLSSLFSSASAPSPLPATSTTTIPQPTQLDSPRQRILHVAPDEILLSNPNPPAASPYYAMPHQRRQQENTNSNDHSIPQPIAQSPNQRLETPPPAPILPEFCLYCVPLRTGVQIITSFDLVTSVYAVGVEAQTLQQYDAPLEGFPFSIVEAEDPDFGQLVLRKEQMYPRAIYVMFLVWSVIMLAKAMVGFMSAWRNYYTPLRLFVMFYILSIVADLTKLLWGCMYRPRWIEPTETVGILTEVVWLLMKMFFIYNIWFWYRTVKAHHDHNTYQSPSHISRIIRRIRRTSQIDVPIEEENAGLTSGRRTRSEHWTRSWWPRVRSNGREDHVAMQSVESITNGVGSLTGSSTLITPRT